MFSKEKHHIDEFTAHQARAMSILDRVVLLRCVREFVYGMLKSAVFCAAMFHGIQVSGPSI